MLRRTRFDFRWNSLMHAWPCKRRRRRLEDTQRVQAEEQDVLPTRDEGRKEGPTFRLLLWHSGQHLACVCTFRVAGGRRQTDRLAGRWEGGQSFSLHSAHLARATLEMTKLRNKHLLLTTTKIAKQERRSCYAGSLARNPARPVYRAPASGTFSQTTTAQIFCLNGLDLRRIGFARAVRGV